MAVIYIIDNISCEKGQLHLSFKNDSNIDKIQVRLIDDRKKFAPSYSHVIITEHDCNHDETGVSIPIKNLFKNLYCKNSLTYEIELNVISTNGETLPCFYGKTDELLQTAPEYKIFATQTKSQCLRVRLEIAPRQIQCIGLYDAGQNVILDFLNVSHDIELVIKRRFSIDNAANKEYCRFKMSDKDCVEISYDIFEPDKLKYACDFFAEVPIPELGIAYHTAISLNVSGLSVERNLNSYKFYKNKAGNLSLYFEVKRSTKPVQIKLVDSKLKFDNVERELYIYDEKDKLYGTFKQELELDCNPHADNSFSVYEISDDAMLKLVTENENKLCYEGHMAKTTVTSNEQGICIKFGRKITPIKLATWCSCFGRWPFNQKRNVNWRTYFDIVCDYFHPTVFSIASQPVTLLTASDFTEENAETNKRIARELNKTAFGELSESKADYLLMDFYADAIDSSRKFEDNTYIGSNLSIYPSLTGENLKNFENVVMTKTTMVCDNYEDYLTLWKDRCDIICKKLTELGFADKVILLGGWFNTKFINRQNEQIYNLSNRQIGPESKFINSAYLTEKKELWDEMNRYFMERLPNTRIIDLSGYNFYADYNNTTLSGPHHFEPNFYKVLLAELCKAILF